jgi:hypothetical protein
MQEGGAGSHARSTPQHAGLISKSLNEQRTSTTHRHASGEKSLEIPQKIAEIVPESSLYAQVNAKIR